MRLLFARHGESEANVRRVISNRDMPHSLTPKGVAQAAALADLLVGAYDVQMIVASPVPRATETATIVAARIGLPISIDPALREIDCGMMEGRGDDEAWAAHDALARDWDAGQGLDRRIPPDGESLNDVQARFLPFITGLIDQHRQLAGDILLVAHGSLLRYMLPRAISNIEQTFSVQHPLRTCELVVTQREDGRLICTDWAGTNLT